MGFMQDAFGIFKDITIKGKAFITLQNHRITLSARFMEVSQYKIKITKILTKNCKYIKI